MSRRVLLALIVPLAAVASGCGTVHPPVPILDPRPDLAGVWEGTYESRDTGRTGDVFFALSAEGDSAVGEVVMVPRGTPVRVDPAGGRWRWDGIARPRVLTIRFVHLLDGEIVGELDPYQDPDCGCLLRTTFRGSVQGDRVLGTFASEAEHPAHDAEGTWRAIRRSGETP